MPDYTVPEGAYSFRDKLMASLESGQFKRAQRHRNQRSKKPALAFLDWPHKARRARAVSVGWRIRSDGQGRGVFFERTGLPGWQTPENLNDPEGVALRAHPVFLGQGPRPAIVYRAQVISVATLFAQSIVDQAKAAVEAQVSAEDQARKERKHYDVPREHGSVEMVTIPAHRLASLAGRTHEGARAAWVREHWEQLATVAKATTGVWRHPAEEPWERDNGAVPVRIQTHEPNLSVDAMLRIIADFRAHGEADQPEAPADFEPHRPVVEALLRAKLWQWDRVEAEARDEPAPADPEDPAVMASYSYESGHLRVIPTHWLVQLKQAARRRAKRKQHYQRQ